MPKSVLIFAFKPLTHTRRAGLLAEYFANKGYVVHVHCLAPDPRLAAQSNVEFICHDVISLTDVLRAKYRALGTPTFFKTRAKGLRAIAIYLANAVLASLFATMHALMKLIGVVSPKSFKTLSQMIETHMAGRVRKAQVRTFEKRCRDTLRQVDTPYDLVLCHDVYPVQLTLDLVAAQGRSNPDATKPVIWFDIIDHITHRSYRPATASARRREQAVIARSQKLIDQSALVLLSGPRKDPIVAATEVPRHVLLNTNRAATLSAGRGYKAEFFKTDDPLSGPISFVMAGTHFETTGVSRAIDFVTQYAPDARLKIIGTFPRKTYLDRLRHDVAAQNLGDRITFEGLHAPDILIQSLANAHAVLMPFDPAHPNLTAILPNRLFDAVAARTPVIAQKGTLSGEWVTRNHCGLSVDFYAISDACQAVSTYMDHYLKAPDTALLSSDDLPTWEHQIAGLDTMLAALEDPTDPVRDQRHPCRETPRT